MNFNCSQVLRNTRKLDNISAKTNKREITPEESEQIIEEILTEVGDSIPSLSDYAVSRAGIYEDHP